MLATMMVRTLILSVMLLAAPAAALPLAVEATGELPGFRIADAAPWLASRMNDAELLDWQFSARKNASAAPDRIEWRFALQPYAGGQVRRFIPLPAQKVGAGRMVAAEVRLFLDGQYQTATIGQEVVQGGDEDAALAGLIVRLTRQLHGAWLATDMTPAEHRRAP